MSTIEPPDLARIEHLEQLIEQQRREIAELRQDLRMLRSSAGPAPGPVSVAHRGAENTESGGESIAGPSATSRRRFMLLAGAAATGAGLAASRTSPAAAADNSAIIQGQVNTGSLQTDVVYSGAAGTDKTALKGTAQAGSNGLWGRSDGTTGAGLLGESSSGYGVFGSSQTGYDLFAGGNGRIGMAALVTGSSSPVVGTFGLGDILRNTNGDLWCCVVAGSVGTAEFRKLAGPATSGQLHILPAAPRAYDSRLSGGPMSSGSTRTIDLTTGLVAGVSTAAVPAGATAALIAMACVNTTTPSVGWLAAFRGGTSWPGNASLNWFGANQSLNVTTWTPVNASGQMGIYCGGGTSDVVIDVIGYAR